MKILIVKLGSIGDIVHTLPVLPIIRAALPNADISWVAESRSAEILRGNRLIDRLIEVDTRSLRKGSIVADILPGMRGQFRELRRSRFDISIDFQGLLKSAVIARLSGAKVRFGFAKSGLREPASRVLNNRTVEVPQGIHVIQKNIALLSQALDIDVPDRDLEFPIFCEDEHQSEAIEIIGTDPADHVILNPAGGWVTKLWPAANFGILADLLWERLRLRPIIALGPQDEELGQIAMSASRSGMTKVAYPSLKGFVELARRAKLYVGGDTGPTHLAVAAGVPIVGLFGPTEWWRNGSPDPADICVDRQDIDCRVDCHRRTCTNWICMDIPVERVFEAVEQRLRQNPAVTHASNLSTRISK